MEHISIFTFTIIDEGFTIIKMPIDGELTVVGVLNPGEAHRLMNHLFKHRDVILTGSKQQMKEREAKNHAHS